MQSRSPAQTEGNRGSGDCLLCGPGPLVPRWSKDGYQIVQCQNCGLAFVRDIPEVSTLGAIYDEKYYMGYYRNYFVQQEKFSQKFGRILEKIHRYKRPPGRILDVGCAAGFFMDLARREGWEAFGVEVSPVSAGYAKEQLKLDVYNGPFEEAVYPHEYFDVVFMGDILEHFTNPLASLREANRVLKAGGLVVLDTPNIASPTAKFYGKRWVLLAPPYHLFYFSVKNIGLLMDKAGFQVLELQTDRTLFHNELQGSDKLSSKVVNLLFDNRLFSSLVKRFNLGTKMVVFATKVAGE